MPIDPNDPNNPSSGGGIDPEVLRELSGYAKQLSDAVAASVKPMRDMSDLSKAIKEQTAEMLKQFNDFAKQVNKTKDDANELEKKQKSLTAEIAASVLSAKDLNEEGEKVKASLIEQIAAEKEIADLYRVANEYHGRKSKEAAEYNKALESQLGIMGRIKEAMKELDVAMATKMPGSVATMELFTGKARASEALGSIGSALGSLVPMAGGVGGLLGLMISGKVEDARFDAIGQVAKQAFDRVGGAGRGFAEQMAETSRRLSKASMAAETDLAAVTSAFASSGVSAREAQARIAGFSNEAGHTLVGAALSLDKALELPAGTMAKMAGSMSQMAGTSAREAFVALGNVGVAAQKSGMDMAAFMQQTMDASSALRLLHANLGNVGVLQLQVAQGMINQGQDRKFAQQYAAAGTASAMQAISGLDVGMSAVVGERLGYGSGLNAWYAMHSGQAGARGGEAMDPIAVAAEMGKIARETTGSRAEQVYMLKQLTGATVGGAEAMLDVSEAVAKGQAPSKDLLDKMNNGLRDEADKTSHIETYLKEIKDGFMNIGSGILMTIVNTLKMIFHAVVGGFKYIMEGPGGDHSGSKAWFNMLGGDITRMSGGLNRVVAGAKQIGGASFGLLTEFGLTDRWTPDEAAASSASSGGGTVADINLTHGAKVTKHDYRQTGKYGTRHVKVEISDPDTNKRY